MSRGSWAAAAGPPVTGPQRRAEEHELTLESYDPFTSTDLLADGIVARMLAGLSTRRYAEALEPVGERVDREASGTSKSAVSRLFVTATAERVAQLCARPLDGQRLLIVFIDGFGFGDHTLVGALGVTIDGTKVPLGVVEGSTENAAVVTRLVADLADRGLNAEHGLLFVVDGGKALDKAVCAVFGGKAVMQRCRRHKERNVTDHVSKAERPLLQRRLRAAWALDNVDEARAELEGIARSLANSAQAPPPACAKDSSRPSPSTATASAGRCCRPSTRPTPSSP